MAIPGIDFRFSNTAGWALGFSVQVGAALDLPWAGTPAWAPGIAYQPGDARMVGEDLHLVDPAGGAAPFTSARSFDADLRPSGVSRWLLVGDARGYRRVPYDFTGKRVQVALKACDGAGNITDPRPKLLAGSKDGGFVITSPEAGGVAWAVPKRRAQAVPPGLYRYDMVAIGADEEPDRFRFGLALIDEGVVP